MTLNVYFLIALMPFILDQDQLKDFIIRILIFTLKHALN